LLEWSERFCRYLLVIRLISSSTNSMPELSWSVLLLWCGEHHSQYFGLNALYDFCVGRFRAAPKFARLGTVDFVFQTLHDIYSGSRK